MDNEKKAEPGTPALPDETAELKSKLEEAVAASKRWQAEYVNYQQRIARERESDRKFALDGLLRELLPAIDTVQLSIAQLSKAGAAPGVTDAVRLVEKELLRILSRYGVKPIDAGATFDPALHDALTAVDTTEHPEGAIVEVLRPGYMLYERVLRPAQVRVARKPTS